MRAMPIVMSLMFVVCSAFSVAAQEKAGNSPKTCVLDISDMSCSSCAATVQKALLKIDGVKAASVSQPTGSAEVTYDSTKTSPEALAKAITKKTGFPSKPRTDR